MLFTARAYNGMVVTPHRLASEAGIAVLRKGGNAVEAAVASLATLCVVYPHMTGLGGDGFWLILPAGSDKPICIDASGRSARNGSLDWYAQRGLDSVPVHGPAAALTMAGAVSGWEAALLAASKSCGGNSLSIADLLADATSLAEKGFPVSRHMHELCAREYGQLSLQPSFMKQFMPDGTPPETGSRMRLSALARTLGRLVKDGFDDFYRGSLAQDMAEDLAQAGSPLTLEDFHAHRAESGPPVSLDMPYGRLYNCPPPTQGLASLAILGILERLRQQPGCDLADPAVLVHCIVEATKQAFALRNKHIADPAFMKATPQALLSDDALTEMAGRISLDAAQPWSPDEPEGDTIWMGVMDAKGNTVSCIQSIYHGFGSAIVLPKTGITWHNRGLGFYCKPGMPNSLEPGKKPLHTLNPAMARLADGRVVSYGTMGGDGQPQTQAAVFSRHVLLGMPLQASINEPRWVIGRTWGAPSASLKIENAFAPEVLRRLNALGHTVEEEPPFSSLMGHAGALVRHPDGLIEGAFDPRSDGSAACW